MSKNRLKTLLMSQGVKVTPIYKVVNGVKVPLNHPDDGIIHYKAEPKRQ